MQTANKQNDMLYFREEFIMNLVMLLKILSDKGYTNANKLLDAINSNSIGIEQETMFVRKVHTVLNANEKFLLNKDDALFYLKNVSNSRSIKITIIPAIDISEVWRTLSVDEQEYIWQYLRSMYDSATILMNFANTGASASINLPSIYRNFVVTFPNATYIPVRDTHLDHIITSIGDNTIYSLTDLASGPENLKEDDNDSSSMGNLMNMFGVDKLLDISTFLTKLKNMSPEDIELATAEFKEMLDGLDAETSELFESVLSDITSEMTKETNFTNGNSMDNIMNIAQSVSQTIGPKLANAKFDASKLLDQTEKMAKNKGIPVKFGNIDPFAMLRKMTEMQKNPNEHTEEDYKQIINDLTKNSGFDLHKMAQQFMKNPQAMSSMFEPVSSTTTTSTTTTSTSTSTSSNPSTQHKKKHKHRRNK